jgi:type II secretory pathway component PulF
MPGFTYVAVDKKGKEKKGNIEADTREKVIDILKNDGLIPVSVKEQGALNKEIDFSIGKKVKPRDLSVFCRQFVSITQAGDEGSPADALGTDREQMAEARYLRGTSQCGERKYTGRLHERPVRYFPANAYQYGRGR